MLVRKIKNFIRRISSNDSYLKQENKPADCYYVKNSYAHLSEYLIMNFILADTYINTIFVDTNSWKNRA